MQFNKLNTKILLATTLLGTTLSAQEVFYGGDVVEIQSCDKWGWCKLSNDTGYVKEWLFKKHPTENLMIKHAKGIGYLYERRPSHNDKSEYKDEKLHTKLNYAYGYVRVAQKDNATKTLQEEKSAIQQTAKEHLKPIPKEKPTIQQTAKEPLKPIAKEVPAQQETLETELKKEKASPQETQKINFIAELKYSIADAKATSYVNTASDTTHAPHLSMGAHLQEYNTRAMLNYKPIRWSDAKADLVSLSLEYLYKASKQIDIYAGAGLGSMSYKAQGLKDTKTVYTLQTGINYTITDSFYLVAGINYLNTNKLRIEKSEYIYSHVENMLSAEIGVGFRFGAKE